MVILYTTLGGLYRGPCPGGAVQGSCLLALHRLLHIRVRRMQSNKLIISGVFQNNHLTFQINQSDFCIEFVTVNYVNFCYFFSFDC